MKNWLFIFIILNSLLQAQESKINKWMAENEMDSVYQFLVKKKKTDTLSNKEFSLLIYSSLATYKYRNGLAFSQEWERKALKNNDSVNIIKALNYRTKLYYSLAEYKKSIAIALNQIAYYERKKNLQKVIQNKMHLGLSYTELKEFENANNVYQEIPVDSITDSNILNTYYINYSNILAGLGNYKKSLKYMLLNLELIKKEFPEDLPLIYSNISSILYELDDYKNALQYLDSASNSLTEYQNSEFKQLIYQNKYAVWTILKDSDSAFHYLGKLRELDKIVLKKDLDEELVNLKTARTKEKELNLKIQESQLELARKDKLRFWIIGFAIVMILSGIALFFYLRAKNVQFKNRNIELEINLLRSQINPHFIFNTLASIQSLIRQGRNEESIQYLNIFSKLTRQVLEDSRKNNVQLKSEIDLIHKYVEIQKLRKDNFDFYVHTSDEVGEMLEEIALPALTLQPFIENAIQHGFKNINYRGKIDLYIEIKGDYLYIKIDDNGSGIQKPETGKKQLSHATDITRERLASMDRKMKTKSELLIKNKTLEKGVLVTIKLPLREGDD